MPHANRPAGPGRPIQERTDAVREREGIDEVEADAGLAPEAAIPGDAATDPATSARHAERSAHVNRPAEDKKNKV